MAEEKPKEPVKWRVGAYVSEETYNKIQSLQYEAKRETGKKLSQGQVLDEIFLNIKIIKIGK